MQPDWCGKCAPRPLNGHAEVAQHFRASPSSLLVLNAGVNRPAADIVAELVQMVRDQIGPVASFKSAMVVERLPKTRSGKILRGTMKKIADGTHYQVPATIDDVKILDEIAAAFVALGYPRHPFTESYS